MRYRLLLATGMALLCAFACYPQATVPLNTAPSRIVGHPNPESNTSLASGNPNLVEGRELLFPEGVALDTSVNPPYLYVADSFNNRVLAWKDATSFKNGQKADLVIGQSDFNRTLPGGPGTIFSAGLNLPVGLAVYQGDLYVADAGNNRILRFRQPFVNAPNLQPDLWLGQPTITSRAANYTGQVDARGIFLASGSTLYVPGLAFDANGNLWITDPGNRRVLRFDAGDVQAGGGPLQATLVLGQLTFQDVQPAITNATRTETRYLAVPEALAFDSAGRLYVSDSYGTGTAERGRVLVFSPPFSNGMQASRIMGVIPDNPPNPPSSDAVLKTTMNSPSGIFFIPSASKMGVLDQGYNRIVLFDSYERWPDVNTSFSPVATAIVGQLTASSIGQNGRVDIFIPAPSDSVFNQPNAVAFAGNDLYVVDTGNHRVLDLPFQSSNGTFGPARAVLGQDLMDQMAPNLVEGREFYFTGQTNDAGLAIDSTGDTPHLYVADTYNNRILGFKDYRQLKAGMTADLVIGQPDMKHGLCNVTGDPNHPDKDRLCLPTGLLVDGGGNLFVADSGNGRVLRFPSPFAHQGLEQADLVLGQRDFKTVITDPTQFNMARPYGLALSANDGLLVSDVADNRVLFFRFNSSGAFTSGQGAEKVFGQQDFISVKSGNGTREMNGPRGVGFDTEGRPYVADTGNSRVLIFDQINNNQSGAPAAFTITGLSAPRGVYVSSATGESWITDTGNGTVRKYPKFQILLGNPTPLFTAAVQAPAQTLAAVQDQYGNLIVADASNRVAFYYPGVQAVNGANFMITRDLAPGMLATLCSPASGCDPNKRIAYFGPDTARADELPNPLPLPTTLADVQVLFGGTPVPLTYVSPSQINFYVPMSAPAGGNVDIQVVQKSTGRIYASGSVAMNTYSPGIFTLDFGTNRQSAVLNQDGTINSPTNPAARCSVISIYATGQGFIANTPPDGAPAPSDPLLRTPFTPQVNFAGKFPEDYPASQCDPPAGQFVQFSGLAPGFVGLWQINVYIPGAVTAASQVPILVFAGSVASSDFSQAQFRTVIAVKNP